MVESEFSLRLKTPVQSDGGATRGPNVTLEPLQRPESFPCPACRRLRPLGLTKKGKPYLTCNDCGIQVFFRGKEGIRRLRRMRGYEELSGNVAEFEPVLDYFTSLRCRLREIRREKPLLGSNSDLDLEEKIVEQEMERLRGFLKDGLKRSKQQSKKLDAG